MRKECNKEDEKRNYKGKISEQDNDIKTFEEIENEWLHSLGIHDVEVSDSEYESSSDSINSDEDLSTACIDDCDDDDAIEEWITSLDDVLKNPVMVDEVQLGNRLFSISDFEELKEKEKILMERKKSGYYRDKIRNKTAYAKICESYSKYITRDMLKMLHHTWSTQKNKSLNKSVTCYAPKDRTYSKTNSLDTRVAIAGAIQVVGYYALWKKIRLSLRAYG